jgi:hypothetical protein
VHFSGWKNHEPREPDVGFQGSLAQVGTLGSRMDGVCASHTFAQWCADEVNLQIGFKLPVGMWIAGIGLRAEACKKYVVAK